MKKRKVVVTLELLSDWTKEEIKSALVAILDKQVEQVQVNVIKDERKKK